MIPNYLGCFYAGMTCPQPCPENCPDWTPTDIQKSAESWQNVIKLFQEAGWKSPKVIHFALNRAKAGRDALPENPSEFWKGYWQGQIELLTELEKQNAPKRLNQ